MAKLKVFASLSLVFLFVTSLRTNLKEDKDVQTIYVRGVRCNGTSLFYPNISCYAKSYNRSFSTVNVFAVLKQPASQVFVRNIDWINSSDQCVFSVIKVEGKLFYKYGTIYRDVINSPRFDWCNLMEVTTSNEMAKQILNIIRDWAPNIVHKCPFKVITDF